MTEDQYLQKRENLYALLFESVTFNPAWAVNMLLAAEELLDRNKENMTLNIDQESTQDWLERLRKE